MFIEHVAPVYPDGQVHVNEFTPSSHACSFPQGLGSQSSTLV